MPALQGKKKLGKKKRFLIGHPYCCFCGATEASTTIDHVPPKACFPDGYWPEEFEFPACEACNQGSKREDQLFGFYSQLLDFNESNRTPEDNAKMTKLRDAIARNYPDALPDVTTARPIHQVGQSYSISSCHLRATPQRVSAAYGDIAAQAHPCLVLS